MLIEIFMSIVSIIAIALLIGNSQYVARLNKEYGIEHLPNQQLYINGWVALAGGLGAVYLVSLLLTKIAG